MRILLLSQYFDPEPMLKALPFARELRAQGHEVQVLTGFPNYPGGKVYPGYIIRLFQRETLDGIEILRVPLFPSHSGGAMGRIANYLSFAWSAALLGPWLVRRPDVIHAYFGNATIGLPAWVIGVFHRAPFVLDIQDLWPDSITASGMLRRPFNGLTGLINSWCKFVYRKASGIAVLSPGFKLTLESRGVPSQKIQVIPNWCHEIPEYAAPLPESEAELLAGRFNIVMAGNMGKVQRLEVILEASAVLQASHPLVQFVMVGGGVERQALEERAKADGLHNVVFLPKRPVEEIGVLLCQADALLVHLKNDPLFAITIPSRIQGYLAMGRPILCGLRGDGASLVKAARSGICFEPENAASMVDAVRAMLALSEEERQAMGAQGKAFYLANLSVQVGTKAFIELFSDVLARWKR